MNRARIHEVELFGFTLGLTLGVWLMLPYETLKGLGDAQYLLGGLQDFPIGVALIVLGGLGWAATLTKDERRQAFAWACSVALMFIWALLGVDILLGNPALPGGPILLTLAAWKFWILALSRFFGGNHVDEATQV